MKRFYWVIISLALNNCLCQSILWKSSFEIKTSYATQPIFTNLITSTGDTHIFVKCEQGSDSEIDYFKRFANGTLTERRILSKFRTYKYKFSLNAQASDDGTHIMLAFNGPKDAVRFDCNEKTTDGCIEIFLLESFDSGENWYRPIMLPRNNTEDHWHRTSPSMLYEIDTGRIIIAFFSNKEYTEGSISISVREPGNSAFEYPHRIYVSNERMYGMNIGQTYDEETKEKVRHLIIIYLERIVHYKSINNLKEWIGPAKLARNFSYSYQPAIATDIDAAPSAIYTHHYGLFTIKLLFSKDNGITWNENGASGISYPESHAMSMCGKNNKGYIFKIVAKDRLESGYISYSELYNDNFMHLNYPFGEVEKSSTPSIQCKYSDDREYVVTAMVSNGKSDNVYFAYGIFKPK